MHRPARCAGFTMIEVIVATSIAVVILLLAASAVRTAMQSLRLIRATSEENALLQRGWIEAMQDVDYWLSHGSPDFPYLAGPMSETVNVQGTTDHPWDKRPFRPVTFRPGRNPAELLPHDPRAWYRNGMTSGYSPVSRPASSYEPVMTSLYLGDAICGAITGDWDVVTFPAGWAPWHQIGDYSILTRALAMGDTETEYANAVAADSVRATTDFLPSVQWWLYNELGHTGVATYMPAGTVGLITRPATNRTVANIGDSSKFYDWGEVPWALARGGPAGLNSFSPQAFTVPSEADFGGSVKGLRRRNLLLGMPGSAAGFGGVTSGNLNNYLSTRNFGWYGRYSRYMNSRSGFNTAWATEIEAGMTRAKPIIAHWNGGAYFPHAMFYPGRAFRLGSDWDAYTLIDRTIEDPFRMLWDDDAGADFNSYTVTRHSLRMLSRFARITQHQPAAATDDDRRPEGFDKITQMRHEIVRYRAGYNDRARIKVVVHNPSTGTSLALSANVIGASLRGARLHWGWKSTVRSDLPPMGDRYAP